jgi:DNA-binding MarR family transcriptional regulator
MPGMAEERPIGWWVKRLDTLLEQAVDAVVDAEGLTRRHWQVLHFLATGTEQEGDVRTALADFPGDIDVVVSDLVARGWGVRLGTGRVGLTPDGAAAHDRVFRAVGRVRRHVADGLSRSEYERTILVLSRMVANIERTLRRD